MALVGTTYNYLVEKGEVSKVVALARSSHWHFGPLQGALHAGRDKEGTKRKVR